MFAKITKGNSIVGVLKYHKAKIEKDGAELLTVNHIECNPAGSFDMGFCLDSFEDLLTTAPGVKDPVVHFSLNPSPKDNLSKDELENLAR